MLGARLCTAQPVCYAGSRAIEGGGARTLSAQQDWPDARLLSGQPALLVPGAGSKEPHMSREWDDFTTEEKIEILLTQAEPKLRALAQRNYLFEIEDLQQVFAEEVFRIIPSVQSGPDAPAPPFAFAYKKGMWAVFKYMRTQANRGLYGDCEACGWHGSFVRWCPECGQPIIGTARTRFEPIDRHATESDFLVNLAARKRLTPTETKVLWLAVHGGPLVMGMWSEIAEILGISHVRVSQLRKKIRDKLGAWES